METSLTRLLSIEHPIVLPQMTRVSTPALVAAVSDAGGLGILATASLSPDATRAAIHELRQRTGRPFGVGIPLLVPGGREKAEAALEEQVPVINFSLGKGDWIVPRAHAYGGKVIATVTSVRHARAAASQGCDALLVVGNEGAGHGSACTSLVLIPSIADEVALPLIAAGGFADGRGLAAARILGAAGIAMGTRLATVQESALHHRTREEILTRAGADTVYTDRFDGMDCRILRTASAERVLRRRSGLLAAVPASFRLAREVETSWLRMLLSVATRGPAHVVRMANAATAAEAMQRAIEQGDLEAGVMPSGQVQELVRDTPKAAELIARTVREAEGLLTTVS